MDNLSLDTIVPRSNGRGAIDDASLIAELRRIVGAGHVLTGAIPSIRASAAPRNAAIGTSTPDSQGAGGSSAMDLVTALRVFERAVSTGSLRRSRARWGSASPPHRAM
jgi:hypothetical protein